MQNRTNFEAQLWSQHYREFLKEAVFATAKLSSCSDADLHGRPLNYFTLEAPLKALIPYEVIKVSTV